MKPFKSIREGNSVEPGVSEINDVPEDPMSYVEIKPKKSKMVKEGKKPEHNLGVGWMLDKDKELGQKVAQNKARSINRAMNATPRKPNTEYDRKVVGYLKKKYNESIDISGIWENLKPEPVVEAFDAEAHKKELDRLMTKHMNAHAETSRLIKAKASQEEINKAQERNNAIKAEIGAHKDKVPKGPAPKPGSAAHYYASKKPGEYTGD
jgi:hypothetical protein